MHVRFAFGEDPSLAAAAVALTKKCAGDALYVDAAATHPENPLGFPYGTRPRRARLGRGPARYLDEVRTVAMPDYIVYLGCDLERDEAGKDIKIWDIEPTTTVEETRELADGLDSRVLYVLGKLGIEPISEEAPVNV
ncbi:hypothetical protein [Corynebacterium striatum]|uniref:hypothetical protein n=1 Tax=Corynebacterium striatum TaxID=43770 RepID=UPI00254D9701|nr:hypothetical protein [Corynebacterium striatum]MDK8875639.1 hypothetical protein [Corynebacterium striatum]